MNDLNDLINVFAYLVQNHGDVRIGSLTLDDLGCAKNHAISMKRRKNIRMIKGNKK